jgi:hypothetical protein
VILATLAVCAVLAAANYTIGYVDGTLPVLPVPQVAAPRMSGNQFILNFPTVVETYQVLYRDNLTDATWTPVGDPIPGRVVPSPSPTRSAARKASSKWVSRLRTSHRSHDGLPCYAWDGCCRWQRAHGEDFYRGIFLT